MVGFLAPVLVVAAKVAQLSYVHIEQLVAQWLENVARHERNTGFRQRFGDSLLMFVYGKVKAGKSSLGNYLAWANSNPGAGECRQTDPLPRFFVESSTDACEAIDDATMARQQKFNVGVVETTSAAQCFTLPGLTWIDSPGLHAMRGANGRLACEYANCADLIVFLTHSSSPGRRSDLEEISHLQSQGKPLVILITASDEIEEDEDAGGNLVKTQKMKPAHDRQAQIDYVRQEAEQWLTRGRIELPPQLDVLAEQHLMDDDGFARACRHLIDDWLKQAASALLDKLGRQLNQFADALMALALPEQALPGFGKIHETRSFKTRLAEQAGRAGGSAGLGIVGGVLGAPAGPVGVLLGGVIGGVLGNWLGGRRARCLTRNRSSRSKSVTTASKWCRPRASMYSTVPGSN